MLNSIRLSLVKMACGLTMLVAPFSASWLRHIKQKHSPLHGQAAYILHQIAR